MFHRKEDNEYVGPYSNLMHQIQNLPQAGQAGGAVAGPSAPLPPEEPPKYTTLQQVDSSPVISSQAFDKPLTRSRGYRLEWTKDLVSGIGNVLSPQTPKTLIRQKTDEEELYPLIELPNPLAGQARQPATVMVYRTWTQEDVKKAVEGIPSPKEDVEECILQMENLRRSYHLNGVEVQQVWMCQLGPEWHHVKGDFIPTTGVDPPVPYPPDSDDLTTAVERLIARIRIRYHRRANYTEIGRCKQRSDEPFDEYRVRMEKIFRAHSGLPYADNEDGPFKQQLKNALHAGSLPEIKGWVDRHHIEMSGGTLQNYINHALHAEKVKKAKRITKNPPCFIRRRRRLCFISSPEVEAEAEVEAMEGEEGLDHAQLIIPERVGHVEKKATWLETVEVTQKEKFRELSMTR